MAQEKWQTGWIQAPGRRGEEERKEKREGADDQVAVGDDTTVHFLAPDEFGSAAAVFFGGPCGKEKETKR